MSTANSSPSSNQASARGVRLRVAIDPPEPTFWSRIEAGLRLDNNLAVPLCILDAQVLGGDGSAVVSWNRTGLPLLPRPPIGAGAKGDRLAFAAGAATDPRPPFWSWNTGKSEAKPVAIVEAGSSFALHAPFYLTDSVGRRVRAVVRYAPLDARHGVMGDPILSLAKIESYEHFNLDDEPSGWYPTHTATVLYQNGYAPTEPGKLPDGTAVEPYVLLPDIFEKIDRHAEAVSTMIVFDAQPPSQSAEEARRKAGATGGPYTWFSAANAWAFEVQRETRLVTKDDVQKLPGRLVALVEWVTRTGGADVVLFPAASEPDPDGWVAWLRKENVPVIVTEIQAKAGAYRIVLPVQADSLLKIVAVLAKRQAFIEGFAIHC